MHTHSHSSVHAGELGGHSLVLVKMKTKCKCLLPFNINKYPITLLINNMWLYYYLQHAVTHTEPLKGTVEQFHCERIGAAFVMCLSAKHEAAANSWLALPQLQTASLALSKGHKICLTPPLSR